MFYWKIVKWKCRGLGSFTKYYQIMKSQSCRPYRRRIIQILNYDVLKIEWNYVIILSGYWRRLSGGAIRDKEAIPCTTWCWPAQNYYWKPCLWCSQGTKNTTCTTFILAKYYSCCYLHLLYFTLLSTGCFGWWPWHSSQWQEVRGIFKRQQAARCRGAPQVHLRGTRCELHEADAGGWAREIPGPLQPVH